MIRPATPADIPQMLALGEAMHAESRYARMAWCTPKVCGLLDMLIASDDGLVLVAERGGEIVGGFMGMVSEHYFSRDKVATDFALFIAPDRRGGIAASRLLQAYREWAQARGAVSVQLGVTTGVNTEDTARLFERCGFERVGVLFEFKGD